MRPVPGSDVRLRDVRRLHVILKARGGAYRRLLIGRKRMPGTTPPALGRREAEPGPLPEWAREKFGERKFAPLDPDLLDIQGIELVLIGGAEDVEAELGIHLEPARERLDPIRDLHLDPREYPIDPAIDGSWR